MAEKADGVLFIPHDVRDSGLGKRGLHRFPATPLIKEKTFPDRLECPDYEIELALNGLQRKLASADVSKGIVMVRRVEPDIEATQWPKGTNWLKRILERFDLVEEGKGIVTLAIGLPPIKTQENSTRVEVPILGINVAYPLKLDGPLKRMLGSKISQEDPNLVMNLVKNLFANAPRIGKAAQFLRWVQEAVLEPFANEKVHGRKDYGPILEDHFLVFDASLTDWQRNAEEGVRKLAPFREDSTLRMAVAAQAKRMASVDETRQDRPFRIRPPRVQISSPSYREDQRLDFSRLDRPVGAKARPPRVIITFGRPGAERVRLTLMRIMGKMFE
jgi:hypothetical protein